MSSVDEYVPEYTLFYCLTLFRELDVATREVLREFTKKRITLTELFCHLWDLYVSFFFGISELFSVLIHL